MPRRNAFLSYSRLDEALASELEQDLEALGIDVWRDRQLTGGQTWWDTVLSQIVAADVVIFVVSAASLESVPCGSELDYAAAVRRQIVPVNVDPSVTPQMSSPLLASREWTEYRPGDKRSVMQLVRALTALPPSPPPPDPLPPSPPVPLSYLTDLAVLARTSGDLTREQQMHVVAELRDAVRKPADRDEAVAILRTLRGRRDLLAGPADAIDALLRETAQGGPPPRAAGSAPPDRRNEVPPPRSPRRGMVLVGMVAAVLVVGGGVFVALQARTPGPEDPSSTVTATATPSETAEGTTAEPETAEPTTSAGGGGPDIAALYDRCADFDLAACDSLFQNAEDGSPEQLFAKECGNLWRTAGGTCDPQPGGYGDDPNLDDLWSECAAEVLAACDELYYGSPVGSTYEAFGQACGDQWLTAGGTCDPPPMTVGDDSSLDQLSTQCGDGDYASCDDLYTYSPAGSEYELWGAYCGTATTTPMNGRCTDLGE